MINRRRPRYIALKIESEGIFDRRTFLNKVWDSLTRLYGEYGASKAGLVLVNYTPKKGFAILRCNHKALLMVRAATAAITSIDEEHVAVHVLAVSGTLKALRRKISEHGRLKCGGTI
jgi:RNase P/RNase MRP subunit POP5